MVKLSEQAQQTVDRTKARFLVVQPDGTIKRKGAWAFNIEVKARHEVAGQNGVKVYDRQAGEFLTDTPLTDTAVVPVVEVVEPVIAAPVDPTPSGAALDAAEHALVYPGREPIIPDDEPAETVAAATPILDQMIEVLADGKPRGQRKTRSKKDGKPKALSAVGPVSARQAKLKAKHAAMAGDPALEEARQVVSAAVLSKAPKGKQVDLGAVIRRKASTAA